MSVKARPLRSFVNRESNYLCPFQNTMFLLRTGHFQVSMLYILGFIPKCKLKRGRRSCESTLRTNRYWTHSPIHQMVNYVSDSDTMSGHSSFAVCAHGIEFCSRSLWGYFHEKQQVFDRENEVNLCGRNSQWSCQFMSGVLKSTCASPVHTNTCAPVFVGCRTVNTTQGSCCLY